MKRGLVFSLILLSNFTIKAQSLEIDDLSLVVVKSTKDYQIAKKNSCGSR